MSLPFSNLNLAQGVTFAAQPTKTWGINRTTGRIVGEIDGFAAVRQAVEIILHVERFRWQIFLPSSGTEWKGLIGQDSGYVAAELQRRIREALMMDDRVTGIRDFSHSFDGDILTATLTVTTVYGDINTSLEFDLS